MADSSFAPSSTAPPPLPQPRLKTLRPGMSLLPPLSRRGHGPGLVIVTPSTADPLAIANGVPWPLLKWAEEGFTVVEIQEAALLADANGALTEALAALVSCTECTPKAKMGMVVYGSSLWNVVAARLVAFEELAGAVVYADAAEVSRLAPAATSVLLHLGGKSASGRLIERSDGITRYFYPGVASTYRFAVPFTSDFHYATDAVAHTRNLTFFKPLVNGPYFDLENIWQEHTFYEFEDRSVPHTMATMVQEPYVNHIPTITGGIGRASLTAFYRDHFIFNNPDDTELELVSQTIGIDRIVDEFIYKFTHTKVVDWMMPGIPPTGKRIEVPFTAIVNFRGDRLYHEHIAWDQGSVLAQAGLLPQYLPYPYAVGEADGKSKYEYRLPVGGIETAEKLRDKNSVVSNEMFSFGLRKVEK